MNTYASAIRRNARRTLVASGRLTSQWRRHVPAPSFSVHGFAADLLGVPPTQLHAVEHDLDPVQHMTVAARLADGWDIPGTYGAGERGIGAVALWSTVDLHDGRGSRLIPRSVTGHLPHPGGTLVASLSEGRPFGPPRLAVFGPQARADAVTQAATNLTATGPKRRSVLWGKVLRTELVDRALALRPIAAVSSNVDDVHLPAGMWELLNDVVVGTLRRADALQDTALAGGRGVLLHGPPGTGKTSICRTLSCIVQGWATVIHAAGGLRAAELRKLYDSIPALAPALVILEDVDTWAGRRNGAMRDDLHEFLQALDGLGSTGAAIVTVMTTNDVTALDDAARRAGRIDVSIEVPPPNRNGRHAIISGLLAGVAADADIDELARDSEGLTAADLREIIRDAALTSDPPITTAALRRRIGAARPTTAPGTYL